MKLFRRLTVRAMALTVICYPIMVAISLTVGREPLPPYIVAAVAATAAIVVSDDIDGEESKG